MDSWHIWRDGHVGEDVKCSDDERKLAEGCQGDHSTGAELLDGVFDELSPLKEQYQLLRVLRGVVVDERGRSGGRCSWW